MKRIRNPAVAETVRRWLDGVTKRIVLAVEPAVRRWERRPLRRRRREVVLAFVGCVLIIIGQLWLPQPLLDSTAVLTRLTASSPVPRSVPARPGRRQPDQTDAHHRQPRP